MKTIVLTPEEISVIEKHLAGNLNLFFGEEKEKDLFAKVTKDAEALMEELDAYDELDDSLIAWYYNKYKAQQP
mgnify:CR=1 FL=1